MELPVHDADGGYDKIEIEAVEGGRKQLSRTGVAENPVFYRERGRIESLFGRRAVPLTRFI